MAPWKGPRGTVCRDTGVSHRAQPCPSRPGVPVTCGPCPSRHTGQGCLGSQYPGSLPWGTPAESHGHRRGRSMPRQAAGAAGHPRGLARGPAWASPAPARPPLTAASAFPPSPHCPLLGRSGRGVREARLHPPPGLASYPRRPRGLPGSAPAAGRTLGAGGEPLPPSGPRTMRPIRWALWAASPPGVVCAALAAGLPTAHYYSRYEFEVSQRVPKVIMSRRQRDAVSPGCPAGHAAAPASSLRRP